MSFSRDCGSKIFLKCFFRGRLFEVIFEHFCRNHHPPPYSFGYTVGASIRLRHRWIGNDRLYKTAASNRIEFSFFHFISDSPDSKQRWYLLLSVLSGVDVDAEEFAAQNSALINRNGAMNLPGRVHSYLKKLEVALSYQSATFLSPSGARLSSWPLSPWECQATTSSLIYFSQHNSQELLIW